MKGVCLPRKKSRWNKFIKVSNLHANILIFNKVMNILSLSWSQSYEIGIEIILLKINKDKNTNAGPRLKCFSKFDIYICTYKIRNIYECGFAIKDLQFHLTCNDNKTTIAIVKTTITSGKLAGNAQSDIQWALPRSPPDSLPCLGPPFCNSKSGQFKS